jgi:hypothetical protein
VVYEKRVWCRKPEGKTALERLRCRWKDNTNMDLKETGCVDWTDLSQNRDKG